MKALIGNDECESSENLFHNENDCDVRIFKLSYKYSDVEKKPN